MKNNLCNNNQGNSNSYIQQEDGLTDQQAPKSPTQWIPSMATITMVAMVIMVATMVTTMVTMANDNIITMAETNTSRTPNWYI